MGAGARPHSVRGDRGRRGLGPAAARRSAGTGNRLGFSALRRRIEARGDQPGRDERRVCAGGLHPYRWDLLAAAYRAVAADCRARGVPCIWVLIPRVGRVVDPVQHRRLLDLAQATGFAAVVDVSDAFDRSDPATLAIHPSDFHPNTEGHALLARRLAEALWPLPALRALLWPPNDDAQRKAQAIAGQEGAGVSDAEGKFQANQAMDLLKKAVGMGYRDAASLRTESALDPLREREDFKKLLAELDKPSPPGPEK